MSSLVIVAIPAADDKVWKISSDKVPHLTLLHLGETEQVAHLDRIMQFVEHTIQTCEHGPFMLSVDYRDTLGQDEADVLFFEKDWDVKWIDQFRHQLLQNGTIRTAFESSQQFMRDTEADSPPQYAEWIPHLTLGYPDTPAKKDDDEHGIHWVSFDRIAVWTEDFDGPSWRLKWPEREDMDTMGWSGMTVVAEKPSLEEVLAHFGVKGMKWGVRTADAGSAAKAVGRGAKAAGRGVGKAGGAAVRLGRDIQFENKVEDGRAREAVVGASHSVFKKQDLPAIKARHGDYGKLTNRAKKPFSKEARAYRKDARETYVKRLETTANSMTNASGNRQYTVRERGIEQPAEGGALPKSKYYWDVSSRRVQHAAEDDFTRLEVVFDDEGWITGLKPVASSIAQTVDLGKRNLAHVSEKAWSEFTKADYTIEQWHFACLIHLHEGDPTSKSECKLPVKTPNGALNRNGVHAAAAALAGARGGVEAPEEEKTKAAAALRRYYSQLDEDPPESLAQTVDLGAQFLEHYGVKGMHWGVRSAPPAAVATKATSVVPRGTKRKTKIKVEGGENHDASEDAIKVAQSTAKLRKSGAAALSNKELQDLQTRLNLEQNVSRMVVSKSAFSRGRSFVRGLTGVNRELNESVGASLQTRRLIEQLR